MLQWTVNDAAVYMQKHGIDNPTVYNENLEAAPPPLPWKNT